ncbi:MAG: 50S ribosomal protein L29 [Chlamydiales bacterium]
MKTKELRDLSIEELEALYREKCQERFNHKNAFKDTTAKPHKLKDVKKTIARILTILREKELKKED